METEKLDAEYARKHWVSQELHGYPIPSEIKHRFRLWLMDLESKMSWEKFWDWGWMALVFTVSVVYLSISLTSCTTVDKTSEEMRESWYNACVATSSLPDAAKETCRMRADKINFGE